MPMSEFALSGRAGTLPGNVSALPAGGFQPPVPVAASKIAVFHLALPPIPSTLQAYLTDPKPSPKGLARYATMSERREPLAPHRSAPREQLPSVRHLLTPTSGPSASQSSHSPYLNTSSPTEARTDTSYFHQSSIPERQPPFKIYSPRDEHTIVKSLSSASEPPRRDSVPLNAILAHRESPRPAYANSTPSPYTSYSEPSGRNLQPLQVMSPAGSGQWYPDQAPTYRSSSRPLSAPGYAGHEVMTTSKPLLQVIREENIPGEGLCWIYEDGSHCRKEIDGELVNAQWGVTKAGKPRKRLAVACTTCREKKVKCDPGEPKCVQCDKFGRECRFQNTSRGQHGSPDSSSYDHQALTPTSVRETESGLEALPSPYVEILEPQKSPASKRGSPSMEPLKTKRHVEPPAGFGASRPVTKRRRFDPPDRVEPQSGQLQQESTISDYKATLISPPAPFYESKSTAADPLDFEWQNDPYEINPQLILHYIDMYFIFCKSTYCIFPQKPFLRWLQNGKKKPTNELMLLYSLLAIGSVFSTRPERVAEGSLFGKIARFAIEKNSGNFSLPLAQSRLMFALYQFAIGDSQIAWDNGGSAFRAVAGLRLNLEEHVTNVGVEFLDYGFNRSTLIECRRRTFWSAFLMDASSPPTYCSEIDADESQRYNGYCTGRPCVLRKEDIFARLPCRDDAFENEVEVMTPYFDNGGIDHRLTTSTDPSCLGNMAYLAHISSIWEDVLASIYRARYQSPESYRAKYEAFYDTIKMRLSSWLSNLPDSLQFSSSNLDASVDNGSIGAFVSLHALYHMAHMKLNRHVRHEHIPLASVAHNVREAVVHAQQFLHIMKVLSTVNRTKRTASLVSPDERHDFVFSTPFPGYATFCAIDILSAGGSLEEHEFVDTLRMINSGLDVIEELSQIWASARGQRKAVRRRIEELANIVIDQGGGMKAWVVRYSMEKTLGSYCDIFYAGGRPGAGLLSALGVKAKEKEVLHVNIGVEVTFTSVPTLTPG